MEQQTRQGPRSTASSRWIDAFERGFPDAYVFVLCAVLLVAAAALLHGASALDICKAFGDGFWNLNSFAAQIGYAAIGGFVVATSPPASRAIGWLASRPANGRSAIVLVATVSIILSLMSWSISLIFSGLLVRAMARRDELRLDYRAAGAAAYLGLGWGFTLGLTSSAAQLQASRATIPDSLFPITGVIALSQTIFTWQNVVAIGVLTALSLTICYVTAPSGAFVRTARDLDIELGQSEEESKVDRRERPGDRFGRSPWLTLAIVFLAAGWVAQAITRSDATFTFSGLNTYNFLVLIIGMLLHWRPNNLAAAFSRAVPSMAGILLQFPFYAAIAHILTVPKNVNGMSLSDSLAAIFVSASTGKSAFAVLVGLYSAVLGFFVPSAGGKWAIEAPYVATAANDVGAHLGWTVMIFNISESLPNLINPFWMLPLLTILGLKAKDIVGFTAFQFAFHLPVVLLLGALLLSTFSCASPVLH